MVVRGNKTHHAHDPKEVDHPWVEPAPDCVAMPWEHAPGIELEDAVRGEEVEDDKWVDPKVTHHSGNNIRKKARPKPSADGNILRHKMSASKVKRHDGTNPYVNLMPMCP